MHSLFSRIFVLFWAAMALIVGGSIAIISTVAPRESEPADPMRRENVALQASLALNRGGLEQLKVWLRANKDASPGHDLYILGPDGRDILGRRLSPIGMRHLDFFRREALVHGPRPPPMPPASPMPPPPPPPPTPPGNLHQPHVAPQIVAADGSSYTVLLVPRRPSIFGALSFPSISLTILGVALLVSALASWWLAQRLSAPIRRIQEGARSLAADTPNVRVSAGLEERRDELAVLARDFDAMADRLRANRSALTQLLRDISHELRSPLARMRVAVGLARRLPEDLPRQLDRLEGEIERLDGLISQVLKLARLHGTVTPFDPQSVDIEEVLEEVVGDANFEGAAKRCTVELEGTAGAAGTTGAAGTSGAAGGCVRGNRELLRSAVENVLRNAVRYSPDGAVVNVSVERGGGGISVAIRDRGPGVPAGDLARIFEPFYRVAESRDRDSGGEGIGLAITAQVMKAHGGTAAARNLEGGGLEVRLWLPSADGN